LLGDLELGFSESSAASEWPSLCRSSAARFPHTPPSFLPFEFSEFHVRHFHYVSDNRTLLGGKKDAMSYKKRFELGLPMVASISVFFSNGNFLFK